MEKPYRVFCCYAREDQNFLHKLRKHLMSLEREELIIVQADIDISPGTEWEQAIDHHLDVADIILLLVSPSFIASDYCFHKEMQQAIARHEQGVARVVPVIIRPTSWRELPFGKLQGLPKDAKPVSTWQNRDKAFLSIIEGIRTLIQELLTNIHANQGNRESLDATAKEYLSYADAQERIDMGDSKKSGDLNVSGPVHNQVNITGGKQDQVIGEQHNTYYPPQRDGIRSLEKGSKALWNRDYPSAKKELRVAVEEIDGEDQPGEAARAHCFLALALLGGKLPRIQGRAIMQSIEELMNVAITLHPSTSYYQIFARIKKDFFDHNGFDHRLNEVNILEHKAASLPRHAEDEENEKYFRRCQPSLQI